MSDSHIVSIHRENAKGYYLTNIDNLQTTELGINKCTDYDYDHANDMFLCLKYQPNDLS